MNSVTLCVLAVLNLWGLGSTYSIVQRAIYAGTHTVVGSTKVIRWIMYLTFCCVALELWKRHVHFTF